ncbi:MAG: histidine--tRNA ligase [Thermoleophilia bacterium]
MAEKITAPKGTYDILPEDQATRRWLVDLAADVFRRYGYGRIDTPVFEDTRLFVRGVGQSTDIVRKEMYTFEDLGGRSLTLRPEGTAPAARAYIEHGMKQKPQPVKLWYHWPMFRYESPQSGRYRQHYQFGIEAFGSDSPALDAEVIGVLASLYREAGLREVSLRLNSMGDRECRPAYTDTLRGFLRSREGELCADCRVRMEMNPLRTFDCKEASCAAVLSDAPRLSEYLCPACAAHHEETKKYLRAQGIEFSEDHTLVRGMDYYTRTTFEFSSGVLGAQSGVGGGGRYDYLVEDIGGPPTPGVGFGTGVERILLALERSGAQIPPPRPLGVYIVAVDDAGREAAYRLAHEVRTRGGSADLDYQGRSVKGQMKQAGNRGAVYAAILGADELAEEAVTLKLLATGSESRVPWQEAIELLTKADKEA